MKRGQLNLSAMTVAQKLVQNASKEIDLGREFSQGPGAAKTFIDEERNAPSVSFSIANETANDRVIVLGSINNSIYGSDAELLAAVDGNLLLDDGVLETRGGHDVTATSNDPGRTIAQMLRYASNSPFRFTSVALRSSKTNGAVDDSNFTGKIKTVFVSPWQKPVDNFLNLRKFQSNRANSPQFADINFLEEGFNVILSPENFALITVKAGTVLDLTFSVGMQLSSAQRAYRAFKAADQVLAPIRKGIN